VSLVEGSPQRVTPRLLARIAAIALADAVLAAPAAAVPVVYTMQGTQAFFSGNGTPPLPLLSPADVTSVTTGVLFLNSLPLYRLSNTTFTAVPEPGVNLGVVLGRDAAARWRRRARSDR
jgi:hypothetical protein